MILLQKCNFVPQVLKQLVQQEVYRYDQYLLRLENLKDVMKRHNTVSFDHTGYVNIKRRLDETNS